MREPATFDCWDEQARQEKAREIVDGEAQLAAVGADLARVAGPADPGVVDENVEAVRLALDNVRELAHLAERSQIGLKEPRLAALSPDLGDDRLAAPSVASVDEHARALRSEPKGEPAPDAVGRAGDEDRLALDGHRPSLTISTWFG